MNKLTKVGLSALCGSLAAVSAANAGDMTVTGGVDMSWISLGGQTTGNPIGMGSNLTFKGAGELNNGWTFDYTVAMLNGDAYSNTNVTVTMGGLGSVDFNKVIVQMVLMHMMIKCRRHGKNHGAWDLELVYN